MKMRYILAGIHGAVLILFFICMSKLSSYSYQTEDMASLNDRYYSVMKGIEAGEEEQMLMDQYGCQIIHMTDVDYTSKLYGAIRQQDVVFDYLDGTILIGKVIFEGNAELFAQRKKETIQLVAVCMGGILLLIDGFCLCLYIRILLPFQKMKEFAADVARGDLETPLHMDKHNYFGAFTEGFDVMREELKKAREGEYEANLSKRELVASLSHDIKTPVATIKALCELLEIKLRDNENVGKLHTINQKADVIDHLISNLFHATLEELEVLKINPTEEPSRIMIEMLQDMNHYGRIKLVNEVPDCLISCDKLRLNQVFDNIISNSYKYAETEIEVRFWEREDSIGVEIRDFGTTLEEIDMFMVCEKFYRGKNAGQKSGSGLGLYLAKTFMEGMGGELICEKDHGFVATLHIMKAGVKKLIRI